MKVSGYSRVCLLLAAVSVVAISGTAVINTLWKGEYYINKPVHTAMEAVCATIAILMGCLLQNRRQDGEYSGKIFLIAMGFFGMGILEFLHSISELGNGFLLFYSVSNLTGALWFSMTWVPQLASDNHANWRRTVPWMVAGYCIMFWILTIFSRETLPAMAEGWDFTAFAINVNILAGVLFLASFFRLMIDYRNLRRNEILVFAVITLVFGLAELTFPFAALWDINWWSRHVFRLAAYGLVFGFVVYDRRQMETKMQEARDYLERRVDERTLELSLLNDQLTREIGIRKRMEDAMLKSHEELENMVKVRTAELVASNAQLVDEVYERRQMEEELRISHERLHTLAAHLQSVREEERTMIAREIHDELGQFLTALKLDMSCLGKESVKFDGLLSEKIRADIEIINSIIQSVKRICTELRPGILDHLGLGPAIEWQAQVFQQRSGIECGVFLDPENINVCTELETALFRIFQESLTNVLRHANATKVNASLIEKDDRIIFRVWDNGTGITDEQLLKPNSFGLLGMRERMYQWRGEVNVKGEPDKGTEITVTVPAVRLF